MIEKCELYCYEGLYLDSDTFKKLGINKIDGIGFLSLLQSYFRVVRFSNGKFVHLDKNNFQSTMSLSSEYCYMIKNDSLVILPMDIYYGIKTDNGLSAVYEHKNVRDAKFSEVLVKNIIAMLDDIKSSEDIVNEVTKQKKLIKTYNSLDTLDKYKKM